MQSLSNRPHPVVNEVYVEDSDPDFAIKIYMPGLHVFRVPAGNGWYTLRYWRVRLDAGGDSQIDCWDGGTYPDSWYQTDWSQFAWGPFGKPERRPRHLYLVK
jgi:hypothetical protein